jgi:hypothetical protein
MILQSFGTFDMLAQYGVLGLVTLGLGACVWYLLKRQLASEERLQNKVDTLQKEINDYIRNDQHKLISIIENNTEAMRELRDIIISNHISTPRKRS